MPSVSSRALLAAGAGLRASGPWRPDARAFSAAASTYAPTHQPPSPRCSASLVGASSTCGHSLRRTTQGCQRTGLPPMQSTSVASSESDLPSGQLLRLCSSRLSPLRPHNTDVPPTAMCRASLITRSRYAGQGAGKRLPLNQTRPTRSGGCDAAGRSASERLLGDQSLDRSRPMSPCGSRGTAAGRLRAARAARALRPIRRRRRAGSVPTGGR